MKRDRATPLAHTVVVASAIIFAVPIIWMVLSSLKPGTQLTEDPYSLLPVRWQWSNYPDAISSMPYLRYLRNTLVLCIGSVIGSVLSCSVAAYAFARIRWRGRNILFGIVIATMLLPWHVTMIPRFLLLRELGLYNTLAALIVPTFLGDAFFIFLLRQFFLTIPEELSEAGRLDGLSEWGIFSRIIIPLSKPALTTVALFQFIASWNDFNGPLLYLSDPQKFPLAYGLEQFISSYADQTNLLLAAATLFTLPIVLLFLLAQRTFLEGIATTGLKG
ncbi:MAG: sugar ABC transporter ATP-binding protein [Planctomycetaceae bacterium]|nr:sugar ABC transporter ATP-binding protein [Planctomycetaceae bacterium]